MITKHSTISKNTGPQPDFSRGISKSSRVTQMKFLSFLLHLWCVTSKYLLMFPAVNLLLLLYINAYSCLVYTSLSEKLSSQSGGSSKSLEPPLGTGLIHHAVLQIYFSCNYFAYIGGSKPP